MAAVALSALWPDVTGPKRKESITAKGRAPMVKMSRRIPPTPVAAPWNGSMNDGWLCDSILKAQAQPSPMSMIPAFSPGPCTTRELRVGRRFKCTREDLYEQCSLHITLKMPSSVIVGSRPPRSCLIFSYSPEVSPCCRIVSGEKAEVKEVGMEEPLLSHFGLRQV